MICGAAPGSLLDDVDLMAVLMKIKAAAERVGAKRAAALASTEQLTRARAVYQPVAERGSIAYFAGAAMRRVRPCYRFSLRRFELQFRAALVRASAAAATPATLSQALRVRTLCRSVLAACGALVLQGLFAAERRPYTVAVLMQLDMAAGVLAANDVEALVTRVVPQAPNGDAPSTQKSPRAAAAEATRSQPLAWLDDDTWARVSSLQVVSTLTHVIKDLHRLRSLPPSAAWTSTGAWRRWMTSRTPEALPLPVPREDTDDGHVSALTHSTPTTSKPVFAKLLLVGLPREAAVASLYAADGP